MLFFEIRPLSPPSSLPTHPFQSSCSLWYSPSSLSLSLPPMHRHVLVCSIPPHVVASGPPAPHCSSCVCTRELRRRDAAVITANSAVLPGCGDRRGFLRKSLCPCVATPPPIIASSSAVTTRRHRHGITTPRGFPGGLRRIWDSSTTAAVADSNKAAPPITVPTPPSGSHRTWRNHCRQDHSQSQWRPQPLHGCQ